MKKKTIIKWLLGILIVIVLAALTTFFVIKSTVVGVYKAHYINYEYEDMNISLSYEDEGWHVDGIPTLLSSLFDFDSLLSSYDDNIATITIKEDFSYEFNVADVYELQNSFKQEEGKMDLSNISYSKEGLVWEKDDLKIIYNNKTITLNYKSSTIIFEKE